METEEVNFGKPLFFWRLDMQQWISDIFPTGELKLSMTKLLPLSFALSYTWLPIWKCILSLHPTSSPSQRRDIFLCQRKLILMILSAGPDSWTWLPPLTTYWQQWPCFLEQLTLKSKQGWTTTQLEHQSSLCSWYHRWHIASEKERVLIGPTKWYKHLPWTIP